MNISEALRDITGKFRESGIATPDLDAEVILSFILDVERFRIIINKERELTAQEKDLLYRLATRRIDGEPVAYITGKREFYSLEFQVNKDVLIPRPETELLVDLAIFYTEKGNSVLDLGTGSGAIAIALKYNRPDLEIFASDISENALEIAEKNCSRILEVDSVKFIQGDLFQPIKGKIFDLIVTNPPYIDPACRDSLQREIFFEPEIALFADNKGMAVIKRIINDAKEVLRDNGMLIMELGSEMSDYIIETGEQNGLSVSILNDYSNLPRVAVFQY